MGTTFILLPYLVRTWTENLEESASKGYTIFILPINVCGTLYSKRCALFVLKITSGVRVPGEFHRWEGFEPDTPPILVQPYNNYTRHIPHVEITNTVINCYWKLHHTKKGSQTVFPSWQSSTQPEEEKMSDNKSCCMCLESPPYSGARPSSKSITCFPSCSKWNET